jgi:hypothetical protein
MRKYMTRTVVLKLYLSSMNSRMIVPGTLLKASASLLADGEPCCGLGAAAEESTFGFAPRLRPPEGASTLLSACEYRMRIGI